MLFLLFLSFFVSWLAAVTLNQGFSFPFFFFSTNVLQWWFTLNINPFTSQACTISGLKSACACLQTVYFPGPVINLLSIECVLIQTFSQVVHKRKEKRFRIWNFALYWSFSSDIMAVKGLSIIKKKKKCYINDSHYV